MRLPWPITENDVKTRKRYNGDKTMKGGSFEALFGAIVDDDRGQARHLLKREPTLSTELFKKPRLELRVPHWIYAKDSPLHVAAAGHRVEIAKSLLEAGANPDSDENHRRSRPLHYAADGYIISKLWNEKNQVAMIRLLLKAGAEINAQDKNGATA